MGQPGFFDVDERLAVLSAAGGRWSSYEWVAYNCAVPDNPPEPLLDGAAVAFVDAERLAA